MELSQRMMVERYELGDARQDRALRSSSRASVGLLTLALMAVTGALLVAAVQAFDGVPHLIVLGALVATTVGLMIAVAPNRRA